MREFSSSVGRWCAVLWTVRADFFLVVEFYRIEYIGFRGLFRKFVYM